MFSSLDWFEFWTLARPPRDIKQSGSMTGFCIWPWQSFPFIQAQQCQCTYVRLNSANVRMGEFQHSKHSALTSEAMKEWLSWSILQSWKAQSRAIHWTSRYVYTDMQLHAINLLKTSGTFIGLLTMLSESWASQRSPHNPFACSARVLLTSKGHFLMHAIPPAASI